MAPTLAPARLTRSLWPSLRQPCTTFANVRSGTSGKSRRSVPPISTRSTKWGSTSAPVSGEHSRLPCFGGESVTDLRFRWIAYLSNDLGSPGLGVSLVYSWMNDANRWQSLAADQRLDLALCDLQRFFGDDNVDIHEQFIGALDLVWSCNTGVAMLLPGQFTRHYQNAK